MSMYNAVAYRRHSEAANRDGFASASVIVSVNGGSSSSLCTTKQVRSCSCVLVRLECNEWCSILLRRDKMSFMVGVKSKAPKVPPWDSASIEASCHCGIALIPSPSPAASLVGNWGASMTSIDTLESVFDQHSLSSRTRETLTMRPFSP